jgi:serine/threonine protein kinase
VAISLEERRAIRPFLGWGEFQELKPSPFAAIRSRLELLDFGIARIGDDAAEITQAGAVLGTPGFMAPEVLAGAPGGVPADIYGIAAALYYALTGKTPKDTNNAPASEVIAGIPLAIDDALARALDSQPERRWDTADEFATALGAAGLEWTASFLIDRDHSLPAPGDDPSIDSEAPTTQVDASRVAR